MGQTLHCPTCGEPYKFYSHSAADQSACRDCVRKVEAKIRNKNVAQGDLSDLLRKSLHEVVWTPRTFYNE